MRNDRFLRVNGVTVRCDFRRVLDALRVLEDRQLPSDWRVLAALRCLVVPRWRVRLMSPARQVGLLEKILREFTYFRGASGPRVIDFEQDFGFLYASFLQCYRIDLSDPKTRLSWKKFCSLLLSLPPDAGLSRIIRIRTRKIPPHGTAGDEEIAALRRAKRFFALRDSGDDPQRGLAAVFHTFSRQE